MACGFASSLRPGPWLPHVGAQEGNENWKSWEVLVGPDEGIDARMQALDFSSWRPAKACQVVGVCSLKQSI